MKKLTILLALAVAALATAGMVRNPGNPLTLAGDKTREWPTPTCPPSCGVAQE